MIINTKTEETEKKVSQETSVKKAVDQLNAILTALSTYGLVESSKK